MSLNLDTTWQRETPPEGILKRDLTRKTQFIRKSFRDEYVADLVESGEIVEKFGANGGEVYFPGD